MTLYLHGGTPDLYIEDRDTGERLAGTVVTVLDADTLNPVTGLADGNGTPTNELVSDSDGYLKFYCESAKVVLDVTDSRGVKRWGPVVSAGAISDAITAVDSLSSTVSSHAASLASLDARVDVLEEGGGGPGTGVSSHPDLTNRDAVDSHPMSAVTGLTAALAAKVNTGDAVPTSGNATKSGILTLTSPPVVPANSFPISAVNGLQTALNAPHTLAQSPVGDVIAVVKAVAQSWGTVSHAAGSWPASRPTTRTDVLVVWIGDTDPGAIANPYDLRFVQ